MNLFPKLSVASCNPCPSPELTVLHRADRALEKVREFLHDERMKIKTGSRNFAEFEAELHRRIMTLEREAVGEALEAADVDVPMLEIEGTVHRRVLRGPATYMTAAGPVGVIRTLYKDRSDRVMPSLAALDLNVGIIEGYWTPLAAKQATWVVAQMTPGKAEELFRRVGNMEPSRSSLDRLPKAVSGRWEDDREAFEATLRQQTLVPENTRTVAVSLDGVLIPMEGTAKQQTREATAARGRPTKGPAGYKEAGCGTLSFCDASGQTLAAVRLARAPEHKKATLKTSIVAELASAMAQRPDLRVVKLADGAKDNWTFLVQDLPQGVEIIDFFHAAEHLDSALAVAHGESSVECRSQFAALRVILLEAPGGVERIITELDKLSRQHPRRRKLKTQLAYFQANRERMRYKEFTDQGLPIGSGVVEAACKSLASQRLKLGGMRWAKDGAQAMLTLRSWDQSERFDEAWALVAATYNLRVEMLQNVRPLPPPPLRKSGRRNAR